MGGEKDIRVIQTEWFDIIYSQGSSESAALLYENADRIYYEIASLYGKTPQARMPVVLSPKREQANAYFSVAFYNHIVIYDTAENEAGGTFTNDFLSVFRHELTHAFSYNMKNKFWTGFDNIFGDALNPAGLFITLGWAEGAAITSESANGEGRLNDEYFLHTIKQAKIENKFPAYGDIQGASDKYPIGAYYNFNGAFNEWLQKEYGMEKYACFWQKCINFKTISAAKAFKSVYGIKLKDAWNEFYKSIDVSFVKESPFDSEEIFISDFFSKTKTGYSIKNKSGNLFSSITSSVKSIAWIESKSDTVWHITKDEAVKENPKPKELFAFKGIEKINLSRDGKLLAVSYINYQTGEPTCNVKLYNFDKKEWHKIGKHGIKDASIVQSENGNYIVFLRFHSQKQEICIEKIEGENEGKTIVLDFGTTASEFTDIGNGQFAFIKRMENKRYICIADLNGEIICEQKLPYEKMAIKNISFDFSENKLYFSYTLPENLPRLASYNIADKTFSLDAHNISGGIFNPVKLNKDEFIYVGKFFRQNRLFKLSTKNLFKNDELNYEAEENSSEKENIIALKNSSEKILSDSQKYKFIKYQKKALLLPVSIIPSYSHDPRELNNGKIKYIPFGLTRISNNPWDSNVFVISAGYSPFTNSGGGLFSAQGGTDTSIFKWSAISHTELDFDGWKQSDLNANISSVYPFGKISSFGFSENADIFYGRGNDASVFFPKESEQKNIFYAKSITSAYYSNIHTSGPGLFEKSGFSLGADFLFSNTSDFESVDSFCKTDIQISPFLKINLPKIIPIECKDFFSYNLPTTFYFSLFDDSETFATASIDCVLFAMEIQKGIKFFPPLFANGFSFSIGYHTAILKDESCFGILEMGTILKDFAKNNSDIENYLGFSGRIDLAPNFGILSYSKLRTGFIFEARYYFNSPLKQKNNFDFLFHISSNLLI